MVLYAIVRLKDHLIRSTWHRNPNNPRHLPRPIIFIINRISRMFIMKSSQFLIRVQSLKIMQFIRTLITLIKPQSHQRLITIHNIQGTLLISPKLQIKLFLLLPTLPRCKLLHLSRIKCPIHKHNFSLFLLTIIMHLTLIQVILWVGNLDSFHGGNSTFLIHCNWLNNLSLANQSSYFSSTSLISDAQDSVWLHLQIHCWWVMRLERLFFRDGHFWIRLYFFFLLIFGWILRIHLYLLFCCWLNIYEFVVNEIFKIIF